MNLEIEINGLKIKLQYADQKQIDRTILASMAYAAGGDFAEVYQVPDNKQIQTQEPTAEPGEKKRKSIISDENGVRVYKNGKTAYKCNYRCMCGHHGIRYIGDDETFVYCHECNQTLNTMPSTVDQAHDENYNYFLAY